MTCRAYNTDLCYTPMIIAETFNRSQKSRDVEFSVYESNGQPGHEESNFFFIEDRPLVVQFGASNDLEFSMAAELVEPYVSSS